MWKKLSAILLVGTLVACSQPTATEQPKEEKKTEKVEVQKPKKEVQKPKPHVMTDSEAITLYSNELNPLLTRLIKDVEDISKLSSIGASDPSIMFTDEYIETVETVCSNIKEHVADIRAVDTHGNKKVTTIQAKVLEATDELLFVADNFPVGVRTFNADLIGDCANAMTHGSKLFMEATQLIQAEGVVN